MTQKTYDHGTYRRYTDGCRCERCRTANAVYKKRLQLRRMRGEIVSIPRERVRRHLHGLLDQGATVNGIAAASGSRRDSVWRVLDTTITRPVTALLARRLLATTLDDLPDGAWVDADFARDVIGQLLDADVAHNRIATDALGWKGWPNPDYPKGPRVHLGTVRKLRRLLEQVTTAACEACGAEPWAGGRWCRPCYFEQTAHITGEAV